MNSPNGSSAEITPTAEAPSDSDDPAPSTPGNSPGTSAPGSDHVTPGTSRVTLTLEVQDCDPSAVGYVDVMLERAIDHLQLQDASINIQIVDDVTMSRYHQQFSGIAGTTDVLTFDMSEETSDASAVEGDLLLCMDEAARQALEHGHDTRDELLLYAVHGLMHLLGEDDHTEADYQKMHQREDALLMAIGVGALFDKQHNHENSNAHRGRSAVP